MTPDAAHVGLANRLERLDPTVIHAAAYVSVACLGLFAGLGLTEMAEVWDAPGDQRKDPATLLVALALATLRPPALAVLLVGTTLAAGVAFARRADLGVPLHFRSILDALVMSYALTSFVVVFRPAVVSTFIVGVLFLAFLAGETRVGRPARHLVWIASGFGLVLALIAVRLALRLDPVRNELSWGVQLNGLKVYVPALLVYYLVERNGWGVPEHERMLRVLVAFGLFLGLESLVAFYLGFTGYAFLGEGPLNIFGMFHSALVASYHVVGRWGIVLLFGALYLRWRGGHVAWYAGAALGALLILSTLNRQVYFAAIVGLSLIFLAVRRGRGLLSRRDAYLNLALVPLVACAIVGALVGSAYVAASERTDLGTESALDVHILPRLAKITRALDVLVHTQLVGPGPGLAEHYGGSDAIPTTVSDLVLPLFGTSWVEVAPFVVVDGRLAPDGMAYTFHNLWLDVMLDWGLVGVALVLVLAVSWYRMFRTAWSGMQTHRDPTTTRPFWALFSLVSALAVSVAFTSKFDLYWMLVALLMFAGASLRATFGGVPLRP